MDRGIGRLKKEEKIRRKSGVEDIVGSQDPGRLVED